MLQQRIESLEKGRGWGRGERLSDDTEGGGEEESLGSVGESLPHGQAFLHRHSEPNIPNHEMTTNPSAGATTNAKASYAAAVSAAKIATQSTQLLDASSKPIPTPPRADGPKGTRELSHSSESGEGDGQNRTTNDGASFALSDTSNQFLFRNSSR